MANIPDDIQWQPKPMLWAASSNRTATKVQLTQTDKQITVKKELNDEVIKELVEASTLMPPAGKVTHPDDKKRNGISIKTAEYELAGAYPFIFDVIGYVITHPEYKKAFLDEGRKDSITVKIILSWDMLLDLALDNAHCAIQTLFKKELYTIMNQEHLPKKIWLNDHCLFAGTPLIVNVKRDYGEPTQTNIKNPKKKHRRIKGTTTVEIIVLKELLFTSEGRVQRPKAYYAKLVEAGMKVSIIQNHLTVLEQLGNTDVKVNYTTMQLTFITPKEQMGLVDIDIKKNALHSKAGKISCIYHLVNYIQLHDNGGNEYIRYPINEVLRYSFPTYLRYDMGIERIHDNKWQSMLLAAMDIITVASIGLKHGRNPIRYKLDKTFNGWLTVYFDRTNTGKEYSKAITTSTKGTVSS